MGAVLLIVIGIALILLNIRAIKKEKQSFTSTLKNADADMEEVDIRLGEMRREFTETIAELQIEIEDLRDILRKNNLMKSKEKNENRDNQKIKDLKKNEEKNDSKDREEKEEKKAKEDIPVVKRENANIDKHTEEKNKNKVEEIIHNNIDNSLKNDNKGIQINEVRKLMESGLTIDEISQKLGVGKGEVLLIKELYLK